MKKNSIFLLAIFALTLSSSSFAEKFRSKNLHLDSTGCILYGQKFQTYKGQKLDKVFIAQLSSIELVDEGRTLRINDPSGDILDKAFCPTCDFNAIGSAIIWEESFQTSKGEIKEAFSKAIAECKKSAGVGSSNTSDRSGKEGACKDVYPGKVGTLKGTSSLSIDVQYCRPIC